MTGHDNPTQDEDETADAVEAKQTDTAGTERIRYNPSREPKDSTNS